MLPETDQDGARIVAEQIMAQMAELALPHAYSPISRQVSVSVGLATARRPSQGRPCRALVEEADRWMYEAKARGRNRVVGCGYSVGSGLGLQSCLCKIPFRLPWT